MDTYSAYIKQPRNGQTTLINRAEHCSADPEQLAEIDRAQGQQSRVKRSESEYALYTISETHQEQPDRIVRMAKDARLRLGTADEFDAIVEAQVPHSTYTDAEAEACSEFVERLIDEGSHQGLIAIAPHGGMIEQWTDQQAERLASQLASRSVSCWRCKGWKQGGGAFERWHITSTDIHEASFPLLNQIIYRRFSDAIAFHGFSQNRVLIGGGADMTLKQKIQRAIQAVLVNCDIPVEIAESNSAYSGNHPRNIVNRLAANGNGIQIEQSREARERYWRQIADAVASIYHLKSRR
jgi:phage replication-related protein YjqB (UPF0714/DUF867 family)